MQVNISGAKCDHETLREAAKFYASCLMDPRMVRNIVVDIVVHSKYECQGDCIDDDGVRNPRFFTINLRKQNFQEMLKTLAHEMVHLKQYAKNEFRGLRNIPTKGVGKNAAVWRGSIWTPKSREDPYYDSPWEVEAYGREVGLYKRFTELSSNKPH